MVFASLEFLMVFLPAFLLAYAASPAAWRNVVLLIGSWLFYGWLSPLFLSLHIVLTIVAWVGGLLVDRARQGSTGRVRLLVALIVFNTAVLCWYKYANIVRQLESADHVLRSYAAAMAARGVTGRAVVHRVAGDFLSGGCT
ncbi:Cellulose acetylase subunit WssH [Pseudomonas amygdali pv. photiniae]|uniref:Cellulose acetylase subunit WssH n=1 Tax=Pseudomonas amygdali pv. photiniae TaxID=251724 RepID=A0A658K2S6_PSEA0|nr:Cellulose acetylase subunit WssH [Pseudomonas amygdali pv. photiniae]